MPIPSQASPSAPSFNVNKRFLDSPRGGPDRYRAMPGGTRRSRFKQAVSSLSRKASSLSCQFERLAVKAPGGARMRPKMRVALRECSHRMGDLIGELSFSRGAGMDPASIAAQLQRFNTAANRLIGMPGASTFDRQAIFEARLKTHLGNMLVPQLADLAQGASLLMDQLDQVQLSGPDAQALRNDLALIVKKAEVKLKAWLLTELQNLLGVVTLKGASPMVVAHIEREIDACLTALAKAQGTDGSTTVLKDLLANELANKSAKDCADLKEALTATLAIDLKAAPGSPKRQLTALEDLWYAMTEENPLQTQPSH